MTILATYREPFGFQPHVCYLPEGETLLAMRGYMHGLPDRFDEHGVICINGVPAPKALWGAIRPKPVAVTEITFHMPPRGGGEDGGKSILSLVASIALTVLTGGAAGGLFATAGGLFAAGSVSAYLLAAGISLAGSLLLSALVPPPSVAQKQKNQQNPGAASAEGNVLEPNAPVPRVVGQRKIYPPLGMEPFTYYDGPDEVVDAAYVLAGPHQIEDIRIGSSPIESVTDVEYEVSEGWRGSPLVDLLRKQSRTEALQAELRGHIVSEDNGQNVDIEGGDIVTALPQVQIMATRDDPDEHQIQISFAQGLHKNADESNRIRVPIRMRMREIGDVTWIELPELHFQAASIRALRATIKFIWTDDATVAPDASGTEGWVEARVQAPSQTDAPVVPVWNADAYFYDSGAVYQNAGNLGSTGVRHVSMTRYTATIYLDEATFPRGRYEFEIIRGAAFENSSYAASSYQYGGSVWNFFGYKGVSTPQIPMSRDGVADSLYLVRSVSIWNEHPLPSQDMAIVAIRARNRSVDRVSCVAGGWVKDWSGTDWTDWTVTSNPAPHLRDIYVGAENVDPVPLDLIDETGLVAWRQACIDLGYTCNALIEDMSLDDASRIVAACGYAKPYMSDIWGVVRDYDRSAEDPIQMFTPRNMSGFQWTKAFARLPEGFRVNYRDETRDFDMQQISVFRPGSSSDSGRMEQITYEGIVSEEDVVARAEYDQLQGQYRGTFYSFDTAAENILCRRGDLVGVAHDMLSEWTGAARIIAIELDSGGDIVSVTVDVPVDVPSFYFMDDSLDLSEEPNLALLGTQAGVAIRRASGVTVHQTTSSDGRTLEFTPAIDATGIEIGDLVTVGRLGFEFLRLIVFGVTPRPNFEASLTLVDEAPELWS